MSAPSLQVLIYPGGMGPMLSAADSDFETGTGSWSPTFCTIASSTAQANTGTHCLAMTATGTQGVLVTTGQYAVPVPGGTLEIQGYMRAAATPRSCALSVSFFDASNNEIQSSSGTPANDTTSGWTQLTWSGTAPTNAVWFEVSASTTVSVANEVQYLDSVQFVAGAAIDVSAYLTGTITLQRGRSRETDQYQAGTFDFSLRNEGRQFDPKNTAGPYYGQIVPGCPVVFNVDGVTQFGGYIDDIQGNYDKPKIATVDVSCLDGFSILAQADLQSFNASSQTTGARIAAVLARSEVNYPPYFPAPLTNLSSSLATGLSTLQSGTFDQIPALDHCHTANVSENGWLFVSRSGILTFFDRHTLNGSTSSVTFSDTGAGGTQPYQGITQLSESLLLFNRVYGTRTGGTPQYANEYPSQARYGIRTLPLPSIELQNDSQALSLCQYIAGRYAAQGDVSGPQVRFATFTIDLQSVGGAALTALLDLDITSVVTVQRTPPGSGSPTTVSIVETIDGVQMKFDVSNSTYTATYNLASLDERSFLILNDPVLGLLDSGNLVGF